MVSRYPGYIPQLLTVGQPAQCEVIGSISEQMSVVRSCCHASGESQKLEIILFHTELGNRVLCNHLLLLSIRLHGK